MCNHKAKIGYMCKVKKLYIYSRIKFLYLRKKYASNCPKKANVNC